MRKGLYEEREVVVKQKICYDYKDYCDECGKEICKGDSMYWVDIVYDYDNNSKKHFDLCEDCFMRFIQEHVADDQHFGLHVEIERLSKV